MLTLDDALYGLRNLSVMDDEETRVTDILEDVEPLDLRTKVAALVAEHKFADAYTIAILPQLKGYTRDAIKEAAIDWARRFDEEESFAISNDMMGVYDSMMLTAEDADRDGKEFNASILDHIRKAMQLIEANDEENGNSEDIDCAYEELQKALDENSPAVAKDTKVGDTGWAAEVNDPKILAALQEAIANPGKVITFTNSAGQRCTTICPKKQ